MGLFDRFRRNRNESVLPQEVQSYYQDQRRQKRGAAIAVAIAAVLVTVLIATALFFAGRAIYRAIDKNDSKPQQQTSQDNNGTTGSDEPQEDKPSGTSSTNTGSTPPPATTPPAASPAPSAPAPAATPSLGDSALPRTGDEGM